MCDFANANETREIPISSFFGNCPRRSKTVRANQNFGTITTSIARELNILTGVEASSGSEPRVLERVNGATEVGRMRA